MQKSKLDKFIQKYNLGGNVNSVKWKSDGDTLTTTFVTPDKSLLVEVKASKFQFEEAELGVYQTDQLKSLIGVLGEDISLDLSRFGDKTVALKIKNGPVSIDYVLSDLSVIADPDYGDISDPINGRDVVVEFKTAEELGASFPRTNIRVKPNQTPITEDKTLLQKLLEEQKDIREIYNELTYDELAEALQEWLNPKDDDEEEEETTTTNQPASTTTFQAAVQSSTDAGSAFDDLFNK